MEQFFCQSEKELSALVGILRDMLKVGSVDINYRPHKRSKSMEQLGYYYGCVLPIIRRRMAQDGNNFSIDEIDAFLKNKLFSESKFNPLSGEIERIVKMKRNSTVAEMSEYLQLVIQFCNDNLGLRVPSSEDLYNYERGKL